MQTHQTDFSTGNVYRNIMEVAVPMIIAQVLNLLYNIVDRIYIGRIPEIGATALTGVGLCFPIITLITAGRRLDEKPLRAGRGYPARLCGVRVHEPH